MREKVLSLYNFQNPQQKDQFRKVLSHFNVSLRILRSRDRINIKKYFEFNKNLFKQFRTMFPWMLANKTVHNYLGHAHQAIQRNGGYGLFHLSEAALEVLLLELQ